MTSNVATLLRLHNKGKVTVGADADLLVLDNNHNIDRVMANGAWHIVDKKPQIRGMFEEEN
ncbi:MAG: hypothetical protein AAF420_03365 [Pseudomonadota bacterium]